METPLLPTPKAPLFSPLIASTQHLAPLPCFSFLNYTAGVGGLLFKILILRIRMWVCICPYGKFTEEEQGGGWRHGTVSRANTEGKQKLRKRKWWP